jgi:pimeloyl-ACP methyl ester carboxylesterase
MTANSPPETTATRFDVPTVDGSGIAVWALGSGPGLVMVHGSIADHTTFESLILALAPEVTVYAIDRRGFGASPDTPGYSIARDFADVAEVVDAVAARTGGPVGLWGHSYGANCAMGGAALTGNVDKLILYEPSLGLVYPPGSIEAIESALEGGDYDAAITAVLVDILELTCQEIDAIRASALGPTRLAAAPTIPRECRAEQTWVYRPGQFDAITAPTLLLTGSDSVPAVFRATEQAAAAIHPSRIQLLDGHAHFAHKTDPDMIADVIKTFIE